jgi:hypothetical protein
MVRRAANYGDPVEELYTPQEVAKMLKISVNAVRALFRDEPGAIRLGRPVSTFKTRAYTTLRIPKSVFLTVYGRAENGR